MEIKYFDELDSTQNYLLRILDDGFVDEVAIVCSLQTDGIGSRGDRWIGERGNLFCSVALKKKSLPDDLPPASVSIYFGFLMVKSIRDYGVDVWLKWPNDIYLNSKKVGGLITNLKRDYFVVGVGVNIRDVKGIYAGLNIDIKPNALINSFLANIEKLYSWKEIFQEYNLEFEKNREFMAHIDSRFISLKKAKLLGDGSLIINGKRVISIR